MGGSIKKGEDRKYGNKEIWMNGRKIKDSRKEGRRERLKEVKKVRLGGKAVIGGREEGGAKSELDRLVLVRVASYCVSRAE